MLACKVFSATMARDREALGETVTRWLRSQRIEPRETWVLQSSDEAFHCLTIVIFYDGK